MNPELEKTDWGWRRHGSAPRPSGLQGREQLGRWGEWLALGHLRRLGWEIVARNWETRRGELDLVCYEDDCLVFVEVKTRRGSGSGFPPEEAIDERKFAKLEELALDFVRRHELWDCPIRFDLVAIETPDLRRFELRHSTL